MTRQILDNGRQTQRKFMLSINHKRSGIAGLAAALILTSMLTGCEKESNAALRSQARQDQQKGELNAAIIKLKNALEASPDDSEARYLLAAASIDAGDALSAEKEIRMALKLGYAAEAAMPVLGKALLLQGRFQNVIDETAPAAARNGAELLCVRADAYLAMGQRDDAKQLYDRVLQTQPKYAAALIGLGRLAYLARQVDAASKYAELALAAEPRNTDALLFKGDLLRAQNQPEQALAAYDQVLAINPGHRSAHVEKAYLAIGMGRFEAAQADLDAARKTTPGSVLVAYTQSLLDFSQGKDAAAQESMQKVLRVAPEHMPSVLLAGAICLNLGSLHQAEHHLRHYLEKNPDNLYARKMLASTLLRSGHTPDALTVLAPALKDTQQDVQLLALAGESYMQARDFNKASEYFEKASVLEPKTASLRTSLALSKLGKGDQAAAVSDLQLATRLDAKSQQAGIALVRTELGLQHFDNAYAAALALEQAQPDNAAVQDLKGMVYIGKNDTVQARASFKKALALQPSYFPAAANLAQLDLREKNPGAARQHLLSFLDKNKTSIEAMTALASLAASERKMEDATHWLEQASAVDPNAIAPAVNLLAQYLLAGQNQKALAMARKLQVTHPDNPDLLDLLGKSQLANGEQENALATYKTLAVALPRSAQVQMQVAALQLLLKHPAAAQDYLKAALAMQPDFPAAQLAQAELYVRKGSNELALMIAARLQRKYPKAAAGFQLEGDVLSGQNKAAQALPAYEQALAFNRTSELTIKIANALRAAGKKDEAGKRLAQWMLQHPDDVRVQLYKAETLLADKQYKLAAGQLEATLKQHPKNVVALNNLALAYQQSQDARAQQVAEEAYMLANDQPVVMDTLGWILVAQGDTARGLTILQKASAQAPQARDIRYHMAMGLYKAGDKAAALKELEFLASGNMQFAQADEARALLKQLQ
jgi:putative PEP-CTERM system TPR-repeat lipoprotein